MMTTDGAREIASGWVSPSPHSRAITAFATAGEHLPELGDELRRERADVLAHPDHYDDPEQCARELLALIEYAEDSED
jgi:hypothetical protein